MNSSKVWKSLLFAAACVAVSGCVVRSVYPWLGNANQVRDPALPGAWHTAEEKADLTIGPAEGAEAASTYPLTFRPDATKKAFRYTATLHRIGDLLLMNVGPREDALESFALTPAHLLYRVVLTADTLALYPVDLESFGVRAAGAGLFLAEGGSKKEGYYVVSAQEPLAAFTRAQLKDATFFSKEALYKFKRTPPAKSPAK